MIYQICATTDPGLTRSNNEDSVTFNAATRICILADGMGGYNAGEVASGMATAFIKSEMIDWLAQKGKNVPAKDLRQAMEICVEKANSSIFNASGSNPRYTGMGTTLVMGVFMQDRLMLGHIGDSRCYRLRNGQIEQITKDHSWRQEQIDAGLMNGEQALPHQHKNLVTRALGVGNKVLFEIREFEVVQDDLYLLCSDGLTDMITDRQIADILSTADPFDSKASQLVAAANEAGGHDNISVLLVKSKPATGARGFVSWLLNKWAS